MSSKDASTYGCNRPADVIGYISVRRDHDITHFGKNEILSIAFGEGFDSFFINLRLQIIDGLVG